MEETQSYGSLELRNFIGPVDYSEAADLVLEVVTLAGAINLTPSFGETALGKKAAVDIRAGAMARLASAAIKRLTRTSKERKTVEPSVKLILDRD